MSKKIKFNVMTYRTLNGEEKSVNVRAFALATVPYYAANEDERMTGINVGIAIPFDDLEQSMAWFEEVAGKDKWDFLEVQLSSDDGFRIPVWVHAGNCYREEYGSACLFGYFSTGYFEPRPVPRTKT